MADNTTTDADRERARKAIEKAMQQKSDDGKPMSDSLLDKMSSAHPQTEADLAKMRRRDV